MRRRQPSRRPRALAILCGLALGAWAAAAPAGQAPLTSTAKRPVPKPAAAAARAAERALDLRLRTAEIRLQADGARRRGYAARLRDDPWRDALAAEPPPVAGPGIPRVRDGERREDAAEDGDLSLRGLLDGYTFPVLTIRLSPET